jgi:ABC-2 type transport system ATP-binding protein/lipopolysaccharide transport system ATP-binding protein
MTTTGAPLIDLEEIGLRYRLAKQRIPSFKEYAVHWMRGTLVHEELWALDGLTLSIGRGESVAIIGHNGAGKSTLLKVISRVLKPTRGRVAVGGTVVPLLELGTGFDVELTGFENIYLNALLLGRSRAEINVACDGIIERSGLGDFVRAPIRNYSTGMMARLGFAIATAWVPDILILDEILAVGDAAFQQRCLARLQEFRDQGTTLLFVSHDPTSVMRTCARTVWLHRGRVKDDGPSEQVLIRYHEYSVERAKTPGAPS